MQRLFNRTLCLLLGLLFVALPALADDEQQLRQLLDTFLQGAATDVKQHERFWADDLIYTSSSGERFGKAKILAGMDTTNADRPEQSQSATAPRYWAEEVNIKRYGTTAVVAFRLMGETVEQGETVTRQYFNTGTFLKRDGQWQAVAWQATKIPD